MHHNYTRCALGRVHILTHAGHSIAFLHLGCDFDRWHFNLILICGRKLVMDYPCAKFQSLVILVSAVLAERDYVMFG